MWRPGDIMNIYEFYDQRQSGSTWMEWVSWLEMKEMKEKRRQNGTNLMRKPVMDTIRLLFLFFQISCCSFALQTSSFMFLFHLIFFSISTDHKIFNLRLKQRTKKKNCNSNSVRETNRNAEKSSKNKIYININKTAVRIASNYLFFCSHSLNYLGRFHTIKYII